MKDSPEPVKSVEAAPGYLNHVLGSAPRALEWWGALVILPVSFVLFLRVALWLRPRYSIAEASSGIPGLNPLEFVGLDFAYGLLVALALFGLHELVHGLAFKWAGGNGSGKLKNGMIIAYAGCRDLRAPYWKYRVVLIAPTLVVSLLGLLVMVPPTPLRYVMAAALAAHLSVCVGDWWMLYSARATSGNRIVSSEPDDPRGGV